MLSLKDQNKWGKYSLLSMGTLKMCKMLPVTMIVSSQPVCLLRSKHKSFAILFSEPEKVKGIVAYEGTTTEVKLKWETEPIVHFEKFIVKYKDDDLMGSLIQHPSDVTGLSVTISGLNAGHRYTFNVQTSSHGELSEVTSLSYAMSKTLFIICMNTLF